MGTLVLSWIDAYEPGTQWFQSQGKVLGAEDKRQSLGNSALSKVAQSCPRTGALMRALTARQFLIVMTGAPKSHGPHESSPDDLNSGKD